MISRADYPLIPDRIMNNLLGYIDGEEAPGGFLYAVLCHDLFRSVARADEEILPLIPLIVHYIHWEVPATCHGSPILVKEWMEKKRKEKEGKK